MLKVTPQCYEIISGKLHPFIWINKQGKATFQNQGGKLQWHYQVTGSTEYILIWSAGSAICNVSKV